MQIRSINAQALQLQNFHQLGRFLAAEKFRLRSAQPAPQKVFGAMRRRNFHAVKFDGDGSFKFHFSPALIFSIFGHLLYIISKVFRNSRFNGSVSLN